MIAQQPFCELAACGPAMDLTVRRSQLASDDLFKAACRQPKEATQTKQKNIETSALGDKVGRVHLHKQNFGKLQTRKMKGLKKRLDSAKSNPKV